LILTMLIGVYPNPFIELAQHAVPLGF